MLKVIKKLLT